MNNRKTRTAKTATAARRSTPRRQPAPWVEEPRPTPTLRFSPTAWAKLLYLRDLGETEVGGFGIAAEDDPLYIEDVQLVRQACTGMSVAFDDQAVADYFDRQVDLGRRVAGFARIWLHTHPGNSAAPSQTDEETFARVFGRADWAVMFILARGGRSYARLRFNVGPGGALELPVGVDYARPFAAADQAAWQEQYAANVLPQQPAFIDDLPSPSQQNRETDFGGPFGADPDRLEWWPDFFDGTPFAEEFAHGKSR